MTLHVEMEVLLEVCSIVGPPYNVKHALSYRYFSNTRRSSSRTTTLYTDCFLVLEAKAAVTVHDPLREVEVPVLPLAVDLSEPGTQDGLVVALDVEADVLSGLEVV